MGFFCLFISVCDASELFGFVKEAFDHVPFFVDVSIMIETNCAGPFERDDRLCLCLIDGVAEMVGIIGFVGKNIAGGQISYQGMCLGDVIGLAWRDDETQRIAKGVDGDMELCRQSARTAANGAMREVPENAIPTTLRGRREPCAC
jgi:hypothetical protein